MGWTKIDEDSPPVERPLMVRTIEDGEAVVAFLSRDNVWYAGGALV